MRDRKCRHKSSDRKRADRIFVDTEIIYDKLMIIIQFKLAVEFSYTPDH